ncbi:MAG: D-2-hydroxyacid dehydrogenase [Saccharofermentans sp.]|nr:D-2-hydroxyacid dehydrogenase [Saccharofermentans sp.]
MKVVVLTKGLKQKHKDLIIETAGKAGASVCFAESEKELPSGFEEPDVIYGFGIETARTRKNLKWLCVPSAGVDYLMKPGSFANEDCILTNSAGAYGVSIAEHMITVALMMMRRITEFHAETLRKTWGSPRPQRSLKDCRITVLGTGDIGSSFAKRAAAFEPAKIIGINRSGMCSEPFYDGVYKTAELDNILPSTDLLVMSLPATSETENILSRERIGLLPEGAYIVNVGRGTAIDEDALADALDSGRLAGAALDVFKTEPLPDDSRLWNTPNLLITPHVAGNLTLDHTMDRNVEMFCEDLLSYAGGLKMKHVVDRKRGY